MWDHLSFNSGQGIRLGLFTMLPCCKLPCTFHAIVYILSCYFYTESLMMYLDYYETSHL